MASIIEQHNDENGIIWPLSVAPYHVSIIIANMKDETQITLAEKMHEELENMGIEVFLDDRNERCWSKI